MTSHRSAITGEFVTAEHAEANPDTTVSESTCRECERLRGVIHTQKVAIDGYREEVERLQADRPVVRTVGDLTARHRGKRVRVKASISDSRPACRGQWIIGTLDEIFIEVGELGLDLDAARIEGADHGDDLWCPYLAYGTDELDTPVEVLP